MDDKWSIDNPPKLAGTSWQEDLEQYVKNAEPSVREKTYAWQTAIGLQAVDGLEPSDYLLKTATRNIEGEISLDEANTLLQNYYKERPADKVASRTEEADKVSARIATLLSEKAFTFSPYEYTSIHKKLFMGIYSHAGKIRDYNITKKEWVLDGDTVHYGTASEINATLEYDMSQERDFSYRDLSMDETIKHLAKFVSRLWQIHVFGEGNTRTTAVFFIKYLRSLGFNATNDMFAKHAWYFRNALVRANYNNINKGIHETTKYLETFLCNLLLNERNLLQNRTLHVSGSFEMVEKPDIDDKKPDIEKYFTKKALAHIATLQREFPDGTIFGRREVMMFVDIKSSRASEFLKQLVEHEIIEPVTGHGKGKYKFTEAFLARAL